MRMTDDDDAGEAKNLPLLEAVPELTYVFLQININQERVKPLPLTSNDILASPSLDET